MCCILAALKARPSLQTLRNIMANNRDGVGVAWIDRTFGVVRWKKGLHKAEDVHTITERIPFPFFVHARFATAGGAKPGLTHPFPIETKPSVALEGCAPRVLAHNGHVSDWPEMAKSIGLGRNPAGWSDTRVVAAMVARKGTGILGKTIHGKFAVLSVRGGMVLTGEFHTPTGYETGSLLASASAEPAFEWQPHYGVPAVVDRSTYWRWDGDVCEWRQVNAEAPWRRKEPSQADRMRWEMEEAMGREERLRRIDEIRARLNAKGDRWGKELDDAAEACKRRGTP
jgi:hypothetical protein